MPGGGTRAWRQNGRYRRAERRHGQSGTRSTANNRRRTLRRPRRRGRLRRRS